MAQEPRLTAHLSRDEKMIKAYQEGKDVYCEIASIAFNVPYEECMEFFPDGTKNAEGKKRRNSAKSVVLGINYGRGISSIAEQLQTTNQKAQEIYDKVLAAFPGLAQFKEDSEQMARDVGYVTTNWGRKRRLPNMQLPYYEFKYTEGRLPENFDPLSDDVGEISTEVPWELCNNWTTQLLNCRSWKEKDNLKRNIQSQGVEIIDNGKKISDAVRQCVNSRVQGSAADLTKLALVEIQRNQELKDLGFRMLVPVHDELIAECPEENAERCGQLLSQLMLDAGRELIVPLACDTEYTRCWYGDLLDPHTLQPIGKGA